MRRRPRRPASATTQSSARNVRSSYTPGRTCGRGRAGWQRMGVGVAAQGMAAWLDGRQVRTNLASPAGAAPGSGTTCCSPPAARPTARRRQMPRCAAQRCRRQRRRPALRRTRAAWRGRRHASAGRVGLARAAAEAVVVTTGRPESSRGNLPPPGTIQTMKLNQCDPTRQQVVAVGATKVAGAAVRLHQAQPVAADAHKAGGWHGR